MDSSISVAVLSAVLGAFFGVLTNALSSSVQKRNDVSIKLVETFLEVRREIVDVISPLTNIPLDQDIGRIEKEKKRDEVVSMYYRHFDFLPRSVLDSMVCLEACLDRTEVGLFELVDGSLVEMRPSQIPAFVDSCCLLLNSRLYVPIALNSGNPIVRMNQAIRLHSRSVLMALNAYASIDDMMRMTREFKKKS